jgi:hypothetical protein
MTKLTLPPVSTTFRRPAINVLLLGVAPVALVYLAAACGGGNENLPPPPPPPAAPPEASSAPPAPSAPPSASTAEAPPPPAPSVQLTQGSPAPDPPAPLPTVKITSPAKDAVLPVAKAGDTVVKLDVKNWKTAKGDAHVHLILDNAPYHPVFDPKTEVVKLSDLTNGAPLDEGQHILVAFPSRASHESVKTKGAISVVPFWVGKKLPKGQEPQDTTKPMLIASRPKGEYSGDMANHVLVDFQLENDTLAPGKDHVHITVTGPGTPPAGLTADATQFGPPFYLDNLQAGSYQVKFELLGADNKPLPGSWNTATRDIKVTR